MMVTHVPNDEVLLEYATGTLAEAPSLMVATHLALCPESRSRVGEMEAVGGAMLEEIAPSEMAASSLDSLLARLDEPEPAQSQPKHKTVSAPELPQPLRDYLGCDLDGIEWKKRGMGVSTADLPLSVDGGHSFLLKVEAGRAMPQHTHEGEEWVMVLKGAFDDETGHYARGDIAVSDDTIEHQPIAAEGEDCVCLVFTDGPLKLTGPFGRFLNPFVKI